MFNLSGSELIFLLLMALIILGPEKLPEAMRKFGQTYSEVRKMATGFQTELRSAMDEPMREMRSTADALRTALEGTATEVQAAVQQTTDAAKRAADGEAPSASAAPAVEPPSDPGAGSA